MPNLSEAQVTGFEGGFSFRAGAILTRQLHWCSSVYVYSDIFVYICTYLYSHEYAYIYIYVFIIIHNEVQKALYKRFHSKNLLTGQVQQKSLSGPHKLISSTPTMKIGAFSVRLWHTLSKILLSGSIHTHYVDWQCKSRLKTVTKFNTLHLLSADLGIRIQDVRKNIKTSGKHYTYCKLSN